MQNYRKTSTIKSPPEFIPHCVHISAGGRVKNYTAAAQTLLETYKECTIAGSGIGCNKVVSVAEIIKRMNNGIDSKVDIYAEKETDEWVPVDGLEGQAQGKGTEALGQTGDSLMVTRNVPAIKIRLSLI
jgi:DNA-binding protein